MSIKTYGIYLAFPPTVQLTHEGLGRYIISFLEAAAKRQDIRFLIACPSWFKEELLTLCQREGIPLNCFEILTPKKKPAILRLYELYSTYMKKPKRDKGILKQFFSFFKNIFNKHEQWFENQLVSSRNLLKFFILIMYISLLKGLYFVSQLFIKISQFVRFNHLTFYLKRLQTLLMQPKDNFSLVSLYRFMEHHECELMVKLVNKCKHVKAWYCPTAFWPSFNHIEAPRLMCVPDVVLAEFPVGFCEVNGNRMLDNFNAVEKAIAGAEHFITYSDHIKVNTLIQRYGIKPSAINVVRHAANDLSHWITLQGYEHDEAAHDYCQLLLRSAFQKASNSAYASTFQNESVKFIFYASQFRPSKNILTLLRAYNYLLKKKHVGHKLILTGNPTVMPDINQFIEDNHLKNDVLCLHGLTSSELAACYKLAELAVNPTLSEGACPFTLTESLSVGTPVVMGKIPVTEEIIVDEALKEKMLFDPYDWKHMADRIEWGLLNREELLKLQLDFYKVLAKRSWRDVVNEHVEILERIAAAVN